MKLSWQAIGTLLVAAAQPHGCDAGWLNQRGLTHLVALRSFFLFPSPKKLLARFLFAVLKSKFIHSFLAELSIIVVPFDKDSGGVVVAFKALDRSFLHQLRNTRGLDSIDC